MQIPVNYLAVVVAAVVAYALSWGWYALFSAIWTRGHDKRKDDMKPSPMPFILAAVAYFLMAWMLAGLMGHLANVTVKGGLMTAFFVWVGFVLTTTAVNQAFEGRHPSVTVIDVGNWLVVLLVMGAIVGAFGV